MSTITRDYAQFMLDDLISEFKQIEHGNKGESSKTNTKALIDAFAVQLNELLEAFNDIETRTVLSDDSVDENGRFVHADGVQLDGIGQIVDLSRKNASLLSNEICAASQLDPEQLNTFSDFAVAGMGSSETYNLKDFLEELENAERVNIIPESVTGEYKPINDRLYRDYLKYKIFLNNSTCTYHDVIKNLKMFWTASDVIKYEEWSSRPATIVLSTEELRPEQNARLFFMLPVIKAAGVELLRMATTVHDLSEKKYHISAYMHEGLIQCTLPPIAKDFDREVYSYAENWGVIQTELPSETGLLFETDDIGDNECSLVSATGVDNEQILVIPSMLGSKLLTSIEEFALSALPFEYVFVPSSVKKLGDYALKDCSTAKKVVLNRGLEEIGEGCFEGCSALEVVIFNGTAEEWNRILIGSSNQPLLDAEIITM